MTLFGIDITSWISWFLQLIAAAWNWIMELICAVGKPLVLWVLGLVPDHSSTLSSQLGMVANVINEINKYIPLDWALSLWAEYGSFMLGLTVCKVMIRIVRG